MLRQDITGVVLIDRGLVLRQERLQLVWVPVISVDGRRDVALVGHVEKARTARVDVPPLAEVVDLAVDVVMVRVGTLALVLALAILAVLALALAVLALAVLVLALGRPVARLVHLDRATSVVGLVEFERLRDRLLGLVGDEGDSFGPALIIHGHAESVNLATLLEILLERLLVRREGKAAHEHGEGVVALAFAVLSLALVLTFAFVVLALTLTPLASLVDLQRSPTVLVPVVLQRLLDGVLGLERDEGDTLWLTLVVQGHIKLDDGAAFGEVLLQLLLCGAERKTTDEHRLVLGRLAPGARDVQLGLRLGRRLVLVFIVIRVVFRCGLGLGLRFCL
mmetsp:Transcript_103058/g.291888  ORF Transcript_103058/g.291888 Transcript_103058/m.291888 type:complete len:336 (-) Transcript_103058:41-1048(-)